jgi:hypothetical protein
MAHTPGPWHVNGRDAIISIKGNRSVAKVYHPEADAKLIAKAPDLLTLLTEAVPIIHSHHEVTRRGDETSCERSCAVRDFMERAQAAIDAATP